MRDSWETGRLWAAGVRGGTAIFVASALRSIPHGNLKGFPYGFIRVKSK
jgi:hypothetical protein